MLGSIGSFGLAGLLAFSPPGEARSLRVQVELPADVEPGPYRGLLSCPDQDRVLVEVGVDGEVSVEGPDGAVCLLDVQLSPGRHLQVQVELGEHSFARVAGVEVEVEAAPVSEPTVIDMEHAKNIPVGESTSREFTAVVDMAPAASRDAAGISLAGSTSAETRLMVVGGATVESFAPGTLTAAGVDDLATSGGFARFMAENGPVDPMPRLGRRWVGLQILDPRGRPARGVPVRLGDRELKTHADGRVVFLEDWDGPFSGRKVLLDVDGRRRVRVRPGRVETVKMGVPRRQDRHRVDLALVLDTTGSMGDELAYLQVELRSVFDRIAAEFPDVDVRWALIVYRDAGDRYVVRSTDFTSSFEAFDRAIDAQEASGGGDNPEAVLAAFTTAEELRWRRPDVANRLILHVADAPPHPEDLGPSLEAVHRLRAEGTRVYAVSASGTDDATELFMRTSALMTGGQYVFLTDDSGYGGSHRGATAACYAVHTFADTLGDILEAELRGTRPRLPLDASERRCGQGGAADPSHMRRPGVPRRAPVSPRHDMQRSLLDDDAEAAYFHRPFVRHEL